MSIFLSKNGFSLLYLSKRSCFYKFIYDRFLIIQWHVIISWYACIIFSIIPGALSLVVNESCENQQLPVRYKYIYSRKGHKQLVHMNFVYTKHSTTHGKTSWRCVQYFSLNRCPATVETIDTMIYAVNHQHNHEDCYEKLSKNSIYEMNILPK